VINRNLVGFVLLTGILLAGCAPKIPVPVTAPSPSALPASPTPSPRPSATGSPTPVLPTATPSQTPSLTPTPTVTPPEGIQGWALVYRPNDSKRDVAAVRWSADSRTLYYALSPIPSDYLLDWSAYDVNNQGTRAIRSPDFAFADVWQKAAVGYPRTTQPFSELLGFVSPEYTKAIFPNAGFPGVYTNPNFIFVLFPDGSIRQQILGPIFRGTVGRAAWIDYETRVIFDYRYEDRVVIYLADLIKGRTETLYELSGGDVEWRVSPDGKYLLIPQDGKSVFLALDGTENLELETSGGMARPEWTLDSQSIYFWSGAENRIISFTRSDQMLRPIVVRRDLEPFSPIPPVYGMPFTVSPDGSRIAFWWENWVWIVELTPSR
jgi:hypothetical protein